MIRKRPEGNCRPLRNPAPENVALRAKPPDEIARMRLDPPALHLAMNHAMPAEQRQAYLEEERTEAARKLAGFVKSVGWPSLRQEVHQVLDSPAEAILTAASEKTADLIVVGTCGRTGLVRYFLGSVAEEVLRRADRDVLVVPGITS